MKTNFWKSAAAFVVGLAAVVACQPASITPVFPDKVITNSDVTTTEETIKFTANLDWEVSVPQETIAFFWLEDADGNQRKWIKGEAGEATVKVGITDEPDFDKDITCEVTLKMGEESRVIATYTLLKSVKEFKAFANVITDGNLTWKPEADGGGLKYDEQATTEVTLVYNGTYGFAMPFRFESGFNYDVDCPAWMEVSTNATSENPVGKRGVCEVIVSADLAKLTTDVTSGELKINVRNTSEVVATITVNLPNFSDFLLSEKSAVAIGLDGKYLDKDVCTFNVQTGSELAFVLVGKNDRGYWGTSTYGEYDSIATLETEAAGTGILNTYAVSVKFEENAGKERKAYLLAMPQESVDVLEAWTFGDEAGSYDVLPDEYAQYVITTFTQEGVKELLTVEGATYDKMPTNHDAYNSLVDAFGEIPIYVINATGAFTVISEEISKVKFYNYGLEPDNTLFAVEVIEGDPVKWKFSATDETYGFIEFQKIEYVSNEDDPQNPTEVVTTVAVAWVEYIPSSTPVVEGDPFAFVSPEVVSGATLVKFSESGIELPTDLQYTGISQENIYVLTYSQEEPGMASIIVPSMPDWGLAYGDPDSGAPYWLTYKLDEGTEDHIYVMMSEVGKVDFFTFNTNKYALVCTRTN